MNTVADVIEGRASWACVQSDVIAFLDSLPDDSVDLLVTSPPYENARTYSLADELPSGQAWVDWMVRVVRAAAPKVKGLIAVNCEGRTRNYAYSGTPFLLFADLHRAGFNMRKPCVFQRNGIPGSGGPDWLRNDWEPVICVTREGKLPFSDPTACGHQPVFKSGGAMTNRTRNGKRVATTGSPRRGSGRRDKQDYVHPEIANPGNVVRCKVGGGRMGHELATENEAPFPLTFAEFFVRTFAPVGGVVADCFSGGGTTCHAAVENGRRFVGCDLRESQVELCWRRMRTVTPDLFAGAL